MLNLTNIPFPMKNKHIFHFLKNNPRLDISIRLFDSVTISSREMKIFNYKTIGKGKNIINILFHKVYKNKKSVYHYFWLKSLNNIKKDIKTSYVCDICFDRFSKKMSLNRHLLICNAMTKEVYPDPKTFLEFDEKSCKVCLSNSYNRVCRF